MPHCSALALLYVLSLLNPGYAMQSMGTAAVEGIVKIGAAVPQQLAKQDADPVSARSDAHSDATIYQDGSIKVNDASVHDFAKEPHANLVQTADIDAEGNIVSSKSSAPLVRSRARPRQQQRSSKKNSKNIIHKTAQPPPESPAWTQEAAQPAGPPAAAQPHDRSQAATAGGGAFLAPDQLDSDSLSLTCKIAKQVLENAPVSEQLAEEDELDECPVQFGICSQCLGTDDLHCKHAGEVFIKADQKLHQLQGGAIYVLDLTKAVLNDCLKEVKMPWNLAKKKVYEVVSHSEKPILSVDDIIKANSEERGMKPLRPDLTANVPKRMTVLMMRAVFPKPGAGAAGSASGPCLQMFQYFAQQLRTQVCTQQVAQLLQWNGCPPCGGFLLEKANDKLRKKQRATSELNAFVETATAATGQCAAGAPDTALGSTPTSSGQTNCQWWKTLPNTACGTALMVMNCCTTCSGAGAGAPAAANTGAPATTGTTAHTNTGAPAASRTTAQDDAYVASEELILNDMYVGAQSFSTFIKQASNGKLLAEREDAKVITVKMPMDFDELLRNIQDPGYCDHKKIADEVTRIAKTQFPDDDLDAYVFHEVFLPDAREVEHIYMQKCEPPRSGAAASIGGCHYKMNWNKGDAFFGCSITYWSASTYGPSLRVHELGHLLGNGHSGGQYGGPGTTGVYGQAWNGQPDPKDDWKEYGDPEAVMGSRIAMFTAPALFQSGFVSQAEVNKVNGASLAPIKLISVLEFGKFALSQVAGAEEYVGVEMSCNTCTGMVRGGEGSAAGGSIWVSFRGEPTDSAYQEDSSLSQYAGKVVIHFDRNEWDLNDPNNPELGGPFNGKGGDFEGQGTEFWGMLDVGDSSKVHGMKSFVYVCSIDMQPGQKDTATIAIGATVDAACNQCARKCQDNTAAASTGANTGAAPSMQCQQLFSQLALKWGYHCIPYVSQQLQQQGCPPC